jgi:ankyrin repeat protein
MGSKIESLFQACREGNLDELTKLLTPRKFLLFFIKPSINARSADGETLLHLTTVNGYRVISAFLIEKGADINVKTKDDGHTPLHWAAREGHSEIAELLITNGADTDVKTKNGTTPLSIAEKGKPKITPEYSNYLNHPLNYVKTEGHYKIENLLNKAADVSSNLIPVSLIRLTMYHEQLQYVN